MLLMHCVINRILTLVVLFYIALGAVHKVRHARRGRGSEKVWQFVTGEGVKSMWRHAYTNFYHTYETWNLKWCLTFCCNRCRPYCDRRGNGQKPSRTKLPGQKPPRTIEIEFVQGTFVRDFCSRPTKNRGGVRDVWRTFGGSRDVWQSVTGWRGFKIGQK